MNSLNNNAFSGPTTEQFEATKATQSEAVAGSDNKKYMTPLRTFQAVAAWIAQNLSWATLSGKPSTFPPAAHSHPTSEVTGLDTALAGKAAASHTHTLSQLTQSGATNTQVPTWNGTAWVPSTPVVTNFQPNPEYAADAVSNITVSNTNEGFLLLIFARQGVDYYQSDNEYAISRNGQSYGGVAGSWVLEYVGENSGPVVVSTTSTTYPWQATWPSTTVVKAPLSRLVGAPLAATAAEGTSAYAARADHVHPFPTAAQIGAAPAGSYVTLDGGGKIPSSQLPSYVDDVVEYNTLSQLQADTSARVSGKIYVVLDTGKIYRWSSGTLFIEISSTLELDDLQIPDAFASVYANVPGFTTRELPLTGTLNGKPRYTGRFGSDNYDVYWTGTNWKAQAEYNDDGYSYDESIATGNTAYPWQATGWTNGGGVTRVGTYNAALASAPLGADAYSGVGTKAAREDHVHPLPTAAQIGAATTAQGAKADSALQSGTAISNISGLQTALDGKQAAGSYATLVGGIIPSGQLPSYVDDVLEFATLAAFPATGESGKIYVATGTNKTYRWSGSAYVEIASSPGSTDVVVEGSTNLYFTAARAVAALASTLASYATTASVSAAISALVTGVSSVAGKTGAVTLAKADVGLGNVDNTSDTAKPISTATQTALDGKAATSHTHTLSQLTQSGAATNQVPTWNGTAWVPQTPASGGGGGVGPEFSLPSLHNGLQAFYNLSDLTDSSGNNRTLTNNGGVTFGAGKIGNAAVFDGLSYLTNSFNISNYNALTISMWIKATNYGEIFFGIPSQAGGNIYISNHTGNIACAFRDNEDVTNSFNLADGEWHHVVSSLDNNSNIRLYADGSLLELAENTNAALSDSGSVGYIGAWEGLYGASTGQIDAVGIWNRALSDGEVALLYNDGVRSIAGGGTGAATAAGARTNLELGTAATTNASAYATAAQGAKADNAATITDSIVNALIFG